MTHKEAIQAMLNGATLKFCYDTPIAYANNYLRYDENMRAFVNADGEREDINDLDLTLYSIKPKRWRSEGYEKYFYILDTGVVWSTSEQRFSTDNERYEMGNYFKTKEEAEAAVVALRKFWKEHRGES